MRCLVLRRLFPALTWGSLFPVLSLLPFVISDLCLAFFCIPFAIFPPVPAGCVFFNLIK